MSLPQPDGSGRRRSSLLRALLAAGAVAVVAHPWAAVAGLAVPEGNCQASCKGAPSDVDCGIRRCEPMLKPKPLSRGGPGTVVFALLTSSDALPPRRLLLEKASSIIPGAKDVVEDALELNRLCPAMAEGALPRPSSGPRAPGLDAIKMPRAPVKPADGDLVLHVAPPGVRGSRPAAATRPDGSIARPFTSIHAAVDAARASRRPGQHVYVYLRGGTHYLGPGGPVALGHEDSNTTISAYGDEQAVVSGGAAIHPRGWAPSPEHPPESGVLVAELNDSTAVFTQLFAVPNQTEDPVGRREIRARYPNVRPQRQRPDGAVR